MPVILVVHLSMGRLFINKQTRSLGEGCYGFDWGVRKLGQQNLGFTTGLFSYILLKEYFKSFCHDLYYVISQFIYCTWVWLTYLFSLFYTLWILPDRSQPEQRVCSVEQNEKKGGSESGYGGEVDIRKIDVSIMRVRNNVWIHFSRYRLFWVETSKHLWFSTLAWPICWCLVLLLV